MAVIHFKFDFSIAGKSDSDDSGTSKRMADQIEYNKPIKVRKSSKHAIIALRCDSWPIETIIELIENEFDFLLQPIQNENGSNFLQKWANEMRVKTPTKASKPITQSNENESLKLLFGTKNQYPLPMVPILPESSLRQLQQLMYAKQSGPEKESIGTLPSKSMEAHIALAARQNAANPKRAQKVKADLSDVSLDD